MNRQRYPILKWLASLLRRLADAMDPPAPDLLEELLGPLDDGEDEGEGAPMPDGFFVALAEDDWPYAPLGSPRESSE